MLIGIMITVNHIWQAKAKFQMCMIEDLNLPGMCCDLSLFKRALCMSIVTVSGQSVCRLDHRGCQDD